MDRAALAVVTFRPGATATPDELPEFIATKVVGWCLSGSRPSGPSENGCRQVHKCALRGRFSGPRPGQDPAKATSCLIPLSAICSNIFLAIGILSSGPRSASTPHSQEVGCCDDRQRQRYQ